MKRQTLLDYHRENYLGKYILRKGEHPRNLMQITEVSTLLEIRAVFPLHGKDRAQTLEKSISFPEPYASGHGINSRDFEEYEILDDAEAQRILKRIEKEKRDSPTYQKIFGNKKPKPAQ
jgi:hypothetical protein